MEIVELTEDNVSEYSDTLSQDIAENIGRDFYRGIAVCENNMNCGAMVWEYKNYKDSKDTESEIYYVSADDEAAIKALIDQYNLASNNENVKRSSFEFDRVEDYTLQAFCSDGFETQIAEGRDILVTVGELKMLCEPKKKIPDYIVALKDLIGLQFWQGIINCLFSGRKGLLEDLDALPKNWYENDISCCTLTDELVNGMLLVHRFPSGILMPVLFTSIGADYKNDLMYMMIHAARKAVERYPADTTVLIRRHNSAVEALSKKFFSEKKGSQVMRGKKG